MPTAIASIETISILSEMIAVFIGYIGIAIILVGCVRGLIFFLRKLFWNSVTLAHVRIELAKYLVLGLEFLVGKDIVESLIEPTWDDLGKLGFIILLRAMLTRFLASELKEERREQRK
jgi:uncharacterized membrane protein